MSSVTLRNTDAQLSSSSSLRDIREWLECHLRTELNLTVEHSERHLLYQALAYHFESGGSRSRALLTFNTALALELSISDAMNLACSVECLHNASLIHDDLQDHDTHRRGRLSVWKKFGSDTAICSGDYLISAAYGFLAKVSEPTRLKALLDTLQQGIQATIEGQLDDLSQSVNQTLSEVATYEAISRKKSGPLLALPITLPLCYAEKEVFIPQAEAGVMHFAIAYQIYDDLLDVAKDQAKHGVHSGLNIITLYTMINEPKPARAATELALTHLQRAVDFTATLPGPVQTVLHNDFGHLERKLRHQA